MSVKTFDPKEVSVIVGGRNLTGFAEDFIKVSRSNDSYSLVKGAAGEGARSKSNDKSGTVEITLLQTSADNDYLSGLMLADELNNSGVIDIAVIDNNGTTLCAAPEAWIKKPADVDMGKSIKNRTWTLECDEIAMLVGGNL